MQLCLAKELPVHYKSFPADNTALLKYKSTFKALFFLSLVGSQDKNTVYIHCREESVGIGGLVGNYI